MGRSRMKAWGCQLAVALLLPWVVGCADFRSPRIDPSGEHFLLFDSPPAPGPPSANVACPPAPVVAAPVGVAPSTRRNAATPYDDVATMLSPYRTVAPVGSQVVMLAGVRGGDGYLRTNRRLEWSIAPGSVGQILAVGQNGIGDLLVGDFNNPRVVTPAFAVGSTTRSAERIGNTNVVRGQGWVTVGSACEGATNVSVFAPEVVVTNERVKTAAIYWVDAQFGFPPPSIASAGTKRRLTTTVLRQTNQCPRPGWIVRYEIACGPSAVFAPSGAPSIEVAADSTGQATAEIVQSDASPGTTQVRIQVFRPAAECGTDGQRLLVKEDGSTLVTWTAPSLTVRQAAPDSAAVGGTLTYRIEVVNPGDQPAHDVVLTDEGADGLQFLQANPAPVAEGRRLQWRLGDLAPRQQVAIEASFRAVQLGSVAHCVEVTGGGGLRASQCANTNIGSAAPIAVAPTVPTTPAALDVTVAGPPTVAVGEQVTFVVNISNRGQVRTTGLSIKDFFGEGLEHKFGKSPLAPREVQDLAPGETRSLSLTFRATRAGQLCHRLEVFTADGGRVTKDACVMAVAGADGGATSVAPPPSSGVGGGGSGAIPLEMRISGPTIANVGQSVVFTAQLTNRGQQPLTNIRVVQQADGVLASQNASEGAQREGGSVVWTISSLAPGESQSYRVQCNCRQESAKACCRFSASIGNFDPVSNQVCVEIRPAAAPVGTGTQEDGNRPPSVPPDSTLPPTVPGVPSKIAVVVDNLNKITAGKNQQFLVTVTNRGTSPEGDIVVAAQIPAGCSPDPLGTDGPPGTKFNSDQGVVRFDPVPSLAPGESLNYRVVMTTRQPGAITLHVETTSRRTTQPVSADKTVEVLPAQE